MERHKPQERREMEQAIIELTRAVNRLADATEDICATMGNLTEKGGKENPPLIPPLKESPKKKSPQSACARVREEEPELAARFDEFWAAYPSDCPRKSNKAKCLKKYISFRTSLRDSCRTRPLEALRRLDRG